MAKEKSSLTEKLLKNSVLKHTCVFNESEIFENKEFISTPIPALNIALSGSVTGGFTSGLTFIAGKSKNFKTLYALIMVASYLKKYEDAMCIFYDSEFGATKEYFNSCGIDDTRVIHVPVTDISKLTSDVMNQLKGLTVEDKVIFLVDSIGGLASIKELEDAENSKNTTDMTRPKLLKAMWRMFIPELNIKNKPMIAINHVYTEMSLYPKQIMGGGEGGVFGSNVILYTGKSQEKEGSDVVGYNFTISADKSRFVKEKTKVSITVLHEGGVVKWSGLLDIAVEGGHVIKPSQGFYSRPCVENDKKFRESQTNTKDFWEPIFKQTDFASYVENRFKLNHKTTLIKDDEIETGE